MNNEPQKIPENEAMDTGDVKKTKSDDDKPATSNKPTSNISPLNFPIAKAKGQAAIVKLYNVEDGTFKVNDMVEFIVYSAIFCDAPHFLQLTSAI